MIIRDGKIAFIGTNDESTAFLNGNANCRTVELAGKTVLPGSVFFNLEIYKYILENGIFVDTCYNYSTKVFEAEISLDVDSFYFTMYDFPLSKISCFLCFYILGINISYQKYSC